MGALAFWKAVVADESGFLERVIAMLEEHGIRYCVVGGVGVNAYADPVVTLDLDVVVATDQVETVKELASTAFKVRQFPYSLNVYDPGSRLQVQFQLWAGMSGFLERAEVHDVLGLRLPVASPADLLQAKIEAAREPTRRASKHLKDLADIARLVEARPELAADLPEDIAAAIRRRT